MKSLNFTEGAEIPLKHTCDGENLSPALSWGKVPDGAKSIALLCEDPDAQPVTWVHWVLYNLPASRTEIPAAVPKADVTGDGARQGKNDFGQIGYSGPCPPRGSPHRYFFKLYALDAELNLKPGATKNQLQASMEKHILAEGSLIGTYHR